MEERLVYHYCSLDTFLEIINNKSIRLSDLNMINDYVEKEWASNLFEEALEEAIKSFGINVDIKAEYYYEPGINSHLDYFKDYVNEVLYEIKPVLMSCFSKAKDVASQWNAYAQDGTGVAIGFNLDILEKLNNKTEIVTNNVVYDLDRQKDIIKDCILLSLKYMKSYYENNKRTLAMKFDEFFEEEFIMFCEVLPEYLELNICYLKNPTFREEEEYRILYHPNFIDGVIIEEEDSYDMGYFKEITMCENFKINPIKFNCINNKVVAYSDLDFSYYVEKGIIGEVVIGAKSGAKPVYINHLLCSNGYMIEDLEISTSTVKYR